jgi:hypothetical protein
MSRNKGLTYATRRTERRIKKLEDEYGQPIEDIILMFATPDHYGMVWNSFELSKMLGVSHTYIKMIYKKYNVCLPKNNKCYPTEFEDNVFVRTGLTVDRFMNTYLRVYKIGEIAEMFNSTYSAVAQCAYRRGYNKIMDIL